MPLTQTDLEQGLAKFLLEQVQNRGSLPTITIDPRSVLQPLFARDTTHHSVARDLVFKNALNNILEKMVDSKNSPIKDMIENFYQEQKMRDANQAFATALHNASKGAGHDLRIRVGGKDVTLRGLVSDINKIMAVTQNQYLDENQLTNLMNRTFNIPNANAPKLPGSPSNPSLPQAAQPARTSVNPWYRVGSALSGAVLSLPALAGLFSNYFSELQHARQMELQGDKKLNELLHALNSSSPTGQYFS